MSENKARSGFAGFMTTMPGVLTGVAAVITALATLAGVQAVTASGTEPSQAHGSPDPVPTPLTTEVPPPNASVETDDPVQDLMDACDSGEDWACAYALDGLAMECFDGLMASCDLLYWRSPLNSGYELYGSTCGARSEEQFGECGAA